MRPTSDEALELMHEISRICFKLRTEHAMYLEHINRYGDDEFYFVYADKDGLLQEFPIP
jgi:hypothetical protein